MQQTKKERKQTWIGFLVGIIVVVGLIVLIVAVSSGPRSGNSDTSDDSVTDDVAVGNPALPMVPYPSGEFTYEFAGINWLFTPTGEAGVGVPVTDIDFEFDQFSRRDGSYVNFRRPYTIGTYKGDCQEVRRMEFDADDYGRPLSYATCVWQDEVTDFAVFQNDSVIAIRYRQYAPGAEASEFRELYILEMTEMVQ